MSDLLRVKFGDDLSVTRECEFMHAYIMGGTDHRLAPHYLGHLGEVIWFNHATQTVVCQSVTVGERSEVVLDWRFDPEVAVDPGNTEVCYVCGESTEGEECGEIVLDGMNVVCHAECCIVAVSWRGAVWA